MQKKRYDRVYLKEYFHKYLTNEYTAIRKMTQYKYIFMINPGVITIYRATLVKERDDGLILLQPKDTLDKIVCPKDEVFDTLDDARNAIKKRKAAYEYYATFDIREVM